MILNIKSIDVHTLRISSYNYKTKYQGLSLLIQALHDNGDLCY